MVDHQRAVLGGGLRVLERELCVIRDVLRVAHRTLERIAKPWKLLAYLLRRQVFVFLGVFHSSQTVEHPLAGRIFIRLSLSNTGKTNGSV